MANLKGALADIARRVGIPAEARANLDAGLGALARLGLDPPPRVLITGSLYLAGQALAENGAGWGEFSSHGRKLNQAAGGTLNARRAAR